MFVTWMADRVGESSTSMPRSQVSGLRRVFGFLVLCGLVTGDVPDGEVGVIGFAGDAVLDHGLLGTLAGVGLCGAGLWLG